MYDLIAVGELLMDMTPIRNEGALCFQPNPGGAPCNFLAMAQKMGARTAFIGKVGDDQFGKQLRETIEAVGIDTRGLIMDRTVPTTLAFVHLDCTGDRSFSFYRKGCADVSLRLEEIDLDVVRHTKGFYFGSLAFTDEPLKSTARALLEEAKKSGALIAYDPNYRPLLWNSVEEAIQAMTFGLNYADVLKVSDEEAMLLTGETHLETAAKQLAAYGIALVCITLGEKGTLACFKDTTHVVQAMRTTACDTTGAGDAFFGTLMQQIVCREEPLSQIDAQTMQTIIKTANIAAGLCVQRYGAIPALPSREAVMEGLL